MVRKIVQVFFALVVTQALAIPLAPILDDELGFENVGQYHDLELDAGISQLGQEEPEENFAEQENYRRSILPQQLDDSVIDAGVFDAKEDGDVHSISSRNIIKGPQYCPPGQRRDRNGICRPMD